MSELQTPYRVAPMPVALPVILEPVSPRTRLLVTGLCRVLLLAVDVLQETYDLPRRAKGRERE